MGLCGNLSLIYLATIYTRMHISSSSDMDLTKTWYCCERISTSGENVHMNVLQKDVSQKSFQSKSPEAERKQSGKISLFIPYSIPPSKKNNPTQTRVDFFFASSFMSTKMKLNFWRASQRKFCKRAHNSFTEWVTGNAAGYDGTWLVRKTIRTLFGIQNGDLGWRILGEGTWPWNYNSSKTTAKWLSFPAYLPKNLP